MNKYILILISLVFFACGKKSEKITIKGVNEGKSPQITLCEVLDGEYVTLVEKNCDVDSSFVLEIDNKGGFFSLKSGKYHTFYLNKGEEIDFSKDPIASPEIIKRIEILNKWKENVYKQSRLVHNRDVSVYEFARKWDSIQKDISNDLKTNKDERFCKLMKLTMKLVSECSKIRTLSMRGIMDIKTLDKKYFNIKNDFSDPEILNIDGVKMWMRLYFGWTRGLNPDYYKNGSSIKQNALLIKNNEIRSLYIYDQLSILKKLTQEIRNDMSELKAMLSEKHVGVVDAINEKFKGLSPGDKAFDFEFTSDKGKIFRLADFNGKFLLIDSWATWCSPCKAQTPYFKKLAEEFKNENIEFVTLSFDRDKKAWVNYIKKNNLKGINLIASKGFKGGFSKFYKITGIPRFILIDPEGKIVDAFAPRPSNPRLRLQIKRALRR